MIQVIIKYGRPVVLAVKKAAGGVVSWIWGTSNGKTWGSSSGKNWGS